MLSPPQAASERTRVRLLAAALLLPVTAAYAIMARFALNVPFIDDYFSLLSFAVRYHALPDTGSRLHFILADQYVEYKLVFSNALTAAQLALVHQVSFSFDFWLPQLGLLGLLVVLWQSYFVEVTDVARRLVLFAPVVLLLFGLNYGEALDWAATSMGYIGTIVLALVSLHLLAGPAGLTPVRPGRWAFGGAWLAALIACGISANAFLLLPLGLIVLVARRAFVRAVLWCACFVLALVPYFVAYKAGIHSGTGSLLLIPVFFLNFLGSASPIQRLALPLGIVVLGLWLAALRTGFYRSHSSAMLGATWLLGSSALAAIGRGRTGEAFSLVSRYQIYSNVLLIVCYGYLAHCVLTSTLPARIRRVLLAAALVGSVLFCIRGDVVGYRILHARRQMIETAFSAYRADPAHHSPMSFGNPAAEAFFVDFEGRAREITNTAIAQGLYEPPR